MIRILRIKILELAAVLGGMINTLDTGAIIPVLSCDGNNIKI
jgi:hypothetical protein